MALKLITPPEPVVTWEEAVTRLQLRVDTDEERELVELYIAAATKRLDGKDGILGRAIATQTWDLVYDAFPRGAIQMPLPPLQSVEGVHYVDANGDEQTADPSTYYVDTASASGWVVPSGAWPATMNTANAIRIRFTAGYDPVPADIKVAILLMTGFLYENRQSSPDDALGTAWGFVSNYKVWSI